MIIDTTQTRVERELTNPTDIFRALLEAVDEHMDGPTTKAVHKDDGQWWFWDECWADRYGPYESEEQANAACSEYADWL